MAGQVGPAGLAGEVIQAAQLNSGATQDAVAQGFPQPQERLGAALEGTFFDGDQQQRQTAAAPVALQLTDFVGDRIDQLLGVIGEVEGALLEYRRQKGQGLAVLAVEPGGGHGLHPQARVAAQAQTGIGSHLRHPPAQLLGAGNAGRTGWPAHGEAGLLECRRDALACGNKTDQHLRRAQAAAAAPFAGVELLRLQ